MFILREQMFDGTSLFLWPVSPEYDESYVTELVYHVRFTDGSYRLVRWGTGFTVTLVGDLAENGAVMNKTHEVVAELALRTGLQISIGPGGSCRILVDPAVEDQDAVALVNYSFQGASIVGADVKFARTQEISGGAQADYGNTLLHEMGHVLGLGHSRDVRDVMTPGEGPGTRVVEFQPGEALNLHMMYSHRAVGNRPPDRDPAVGVRSVATPTTFVILD
jgi:hypothetical protein